MDFDYSIFILFFFKLVILFITFISSQDPHVLLESKFMHKFDLQRKHTRKCIYKKNSWRKNDTIFITEV